MMHSGALLEAPPQPDISGSDGGDDGAPLSSGNGDEEDVFEEARAIDSKAFSAGGDAPEDGRSGGDTNDPGARASPTPLDEPHMDAPVGVVQPEWGGSISSLVEPGSGEVAVRPGAASGGSGHGGAPVRFLPECCACGPWVHGCKRFQNRPALRGYERIALLVPRVLLSRYLCRRDVQLPTPSVMHEAHRPSAYS